MSDKTELPKEWLIEAENVAEIAGNYLQGAKAMRDAMEKMLKENLAQINKDLKAAKERENILLLNGERTAVEILLTELQTLTPTQDGK